MSKILKPPPNDFQDSYEDKSQENSKPVRYANLRGNTTKVSKSLSNGNDWISKINQFYNKLPQPLKLLFPLDLPNSGNNNDDDDDSSDDGSKVNSENNVIAQKPADVRQGTSWQDVNFIYSIPGEDNEQGLVVLADGTLRKYLICRGINALLYDEDGRKSLSDQFTAFVNSCDSDIQIIVKSRNLPVDEYLSKYQTLIKTDDDYLKWYANYTDDWFRGVQDVSFVPQREFYVVVSYSPPDSIKKMGSKPWSGRRSLNKHQEYLETLDRLVKTAEEQLRLANLRPRILNRKEVRNLIYADLNPSLSARMPDAPASVQGVSEASVLSQSALKVTDEYLWLDGKYIGTLYMTNPPHETWMGWLVDLLTLSVEYNLTLFVHTCNQDEVRKQLKDKHKLGTMAQTQLLGTPDLESIESTKGAEASILEFLRSSNKAFDISMYISTKADKWETLRQNMDEVIRVFKNKGANFDRAQKLQLDAWQSTMCVGVDKLAITHRVMSPVVGTFWPFFTASCGTPDGVPFGFALASREPVLLNPFFRGAGKDANNMFVVGTTGAGKSFAVSMLILRLLPLGTRFVLIDKTVDKFGAYRFITELLGESLCAYVDLGPNSGMILNPFDLGPEDINPDRPGEPSPDKITSLLSLIDLMLSPEGREELSVEEKSLLDGLIRVTYMDCYFRNTVPTMSDLARVTSQAASDEVDSLQRDRLQQFARGLSLFTRQGAFGGILDGYTNIDTEKLFIVFDTREVNEARLERIAVYILADFIRRKAAECKARNIRFAAIIDEAATLMRFKAGARLLDDLSRRARHYGMMLVSITQQLKDFFRSEEQADSVVKNAHMKIVLRQDPSDLKILKETLRLTNAEVDAIERFSKDEEKRKDSQCLLIVGSIHGTIRLVPSQMDYWVCTSEPIRDIPRRRKMIEEVKLKNPKLNKTDACRHAVYYLAMNTLEGS